MFRYSGTQNTAWLEWAPPSRAMIGSDSQWWGWMGGGCMHVTKNVFEGVRTQQHSSLSTHMARPIKQSTHKCRRSQEAEKYVPNQLREHRARRRSGQQPQRHQQKTSFSNAADLQCTLITYKRDLDFLIDHINASFFLLISVISVRTLNGDNCVHAMQLPDRRGDAG